MSGSPPPGDRDDLIGRLLTGEIDLDDEELVAAMAADPEFAHEVRALHSLSLEMDVLASGGSAARAQGPEPWQGADRTVVEAVRRRLLRPSLARRLLWPLVAAAALLAAVWLLSGPPLPLAKPDTPLAPVQLWPDGEVTRAELLARGFHALGVSAEQAHAATFELFRADGQRMGDPKTLTSRAELDAMKWVPSRDFVEQLPVEFGWTLSLHASGGKRKQWSASVKVR